MQPFACADNFISGAMGGLENGVTTNQGAVGSLLKKTSTALNYAACASLGANFLSLFSKYNCCPKEAFKIHIFQCIEEFCEFYANASPELRKCLATSVVDIRINVNKYVDAAARVAECCNICSVSTFHMYFWLSFKIDKCSFLAIA